MKKRSMLAIASLATGFVVAAVTPSHAIGESLGTVDVNKTLRDLNQQVAKGNKLALAEDTQKKRR